MLKLKKMFCVLTLIFSLRKLRYSAALRWKNLPDGQLAFIKRLNSPQRTGDAEKARRNI